MASVDVEDDVRSAGEEGGDERSHVELDRILNLARDRASSLSAPGTAVNMPEGQIGLGSEQHPPTEDWNCEQNGEPPQIGGGVSVLDQSTS
jgi:hypothetical protein